MNLSTGQDDRFGPITRELVRFGAQWRWEDIPEQARHEARRSLLNYFAVALAGANDPTIDIAAGVFAGFRAGGQANVIGRGTRTDILHAASLNAMAANVFDYDDTHPATIIHPTAPVAPVVFALAQTRAVSGARLLQAFVLGAEVECRMGNALTPSHYARGWHITSTCGVFGAAIAAARLLGLDARHTAWALGSAGNQTGGLVETLGTMAKSIAVGNAARNGLLSALLARAGYAGPDQPIEGPRGVLNVLSDAPAPDRLIGDLGRRWELCRNTYKPYPCGVVLHPVIDAVLALARESMPSTMDPGRVARVDLTGHPLLRQRTDRPGVRTGRESQVSAQHAIAVCLLHGRADLAEFSDAAVADPRAHALDTRVHFHDDETCAADAVEVRITLQDGSSHVRRVEAARGSAGNPLTDADLEDKLRRLCAHGGTGCDAQAIIDGVWGLEAATDAGALMAHAAGRPRA
ncbi:MmgE/PrpD family protein [Bordetella bronchialis]|uniref:MmgE/PrpD family protein n=1 Tax=Bordetella bronchialis TaxID=463025 RepID=A0A193FTG8_9BORD|nr:MmgE/PrpD family protein [Bordetella bronchialis]ANN71052.1 MmgE/PrpD family protein [Bordetella bronchialis]